MSSTRLPGKSLADVAGRPLIQRVVDRVRRAQFVDDVFVLTSDEPSDDPLAAWCEEHDVPVRRGPLHDVLARYLALLDELRPDYLVRVTGDCPFVEPAFVDRQLEALARFDGDACWVARRDIEGVLGGQTALSARILRQIATSDDPRDREHVGSFYLRGHRDSVRFVELIVPDAYACQNLRLQVDEASDLEFVREVYGSIDAATRSVVEILDWLERRGERTNAHVEESVDNQAIRRMDRNMGVETVGTWRLEPGS